MEAMVVDSNAEAGSANRGPKPEEFGLDICQLGGDRRHLMALPPETRSSFTALLELPANQAVELLVHTPAEAVDTPPPPPPNPTSARRLSEEALDSHCLPAALPFPPPPIFPSDAALIDCAAKFPVFAPLETSPVSSHSKPPHVVKQEPLDSDSNANSSPAVSDPTVQKPANKRKDRENKAKESNKKNKKASANETSVPKENGGEKLPYVHVRARRGQATDSHSLAERARREKINARMKLLQELVPGCNKNCHHDLPENYLSNLGANNEWAQRRFADIIPLVDWKLIADIETWISGTASVLEEIINHVHSLQRQVEFLSMRLAAVTPRIDFNLDNFLAADNGPPLESNFLGVITPPVCPESSVRAESQQLWHLDGFHQPILNREEDSNFVTPETAPLSYDSLANSGILHSNQLKMEL